MSRWSILVTAKMPDYVERDIAAAFDATFNATGEKLTNDQVLKGLEGKDALFGNVGVKMDADFFARLPSSVKAVGTYSVGYDHVDLAAAKARGLPVFNTPDVLTDTVAECAMLLTLSSARRKPSAGSGGCRMNTSANASPSTGPIGRPRRCCTESRSGIGRSTMSR